MGHEAKRKKKTTGDGLLKQLSLTAMFAKAFTPSQGMMTHTYNQTPEKQ
jgi:hypothetical protein